MITQVDGGFMSDYLFSSYLFVGFWFQLFMVQSYNPRWHIYIWVIYSLFFAYFCIYSLFRVGVGKSGDAWLLMKADEGENTTAAKHSGHFGCQLVRVTAFGSKSSLTIFLRFLSGSVTQNSSHNHWKCSYKIYDPVLRSQVSKWYQLNNNQWLRLFPWCCDDDFRRVPDSWYVFVKPSQTANDGFHHIYIQYNYTKILVNLALYCFKTAF